MAKNIDHVQHVKSSVVVEGKPKLPQPSALVEGELAINYADGVETISIKNASGDIVTFSSDNYYSEQKLGSGFTGENSGITVTDALENLEVGSEVEISSGITPTGETVELWVDESVDPTVVDAYTKAEVNDLLANKADTADTFTKAELSGSSATVTVASADTALALYAESATTVASGASIVLEGEDGSPVKVNKDSFMRAVREALGDLIKNNDKGTSINGVAVTDANNDLGSVTAANLASILGVEGGVVEDANNCTSTMLYYITGQSLNVPSYVSFVFNIIMAQFPNWKFQFGFQSFYGDKVYYRKCQNGDWMSWREL